MVESQDFRLASVARALTNFVGFFEFAGAERLQSRAELRRSITTDNNCDHGTVSLTSHAKDEQLFERGEMQWQRDLDGRRTAPDTKL